MPLRHRDSIGSGLFFVTTSTRQREVMFKSSQHYALVANKIEHYRERENAQVHAYVIMPNHFHLLISVPKEKSLSIFMRDVKKIIAREYCQLAEIPLRPFWQSRFDDLLIYSEEKYIIKFNYIHNNPVKAGLERQPEDWEYSSAGFYVNGKPGRITVTPVSF